MFLVCSFIGGRAFAAYELQRPTWCVVDCGLNHTIGTVDYADGLDEGDGDGYRLDCSIGPLGEVHWLAGTILVESGFYHINCSSWIANPTFVFNDAEISSTTIKFKLKSDNPEWTQYAIAFSSAINPSQLFTGTTYYIKKDGSWGTSFNEANDWNPASFYEQIKLTSLNPNTIYGFKIKSKSPYLPSPELPSTLWSGNTENYTWTHIQTPGINVTVYITSATVTAVGAFTNLGVGLSGINFGKEGEAWKGWTTNTSYAFTGLTHNTSYTFKVKARNGRQYETAVSSTTKYTLCGPPENPYITNVSSCSLTVGWSDSYLGAPEYYRIKENESVIQDNYTQTSLNRANLPNVDFRYTYKIYAVNKSSDPNNEISSVTISTYTKCSIPPAPQIVDVSSDTTKIIINGRNNQYYTEYSIRVSGPGSVKYVQNDHTVGVNEVFNKINPGWGSPLTITNLGSNVEYAISVQARNSYKNVTGYGASVSSCTYAAVPRLEVVEENKLDGWVRIVIRQGNNSPETEYVIFERANPGTGWQPIGYVKPDGTIDPHNPVWETRGESGGDKWGGDDGFVVRDLNLTDYEFRFKSQARRTINGYSKKETDWSPEVYAGKGVQIPTASIGTTELVPGITVYYNSNQTITFTSMGAEIHYTYTTNGSIPSDPTKSDPLGNSLALTASDGQSITYTIKAKAWKDPLESEVGGPWIVVIDKEPPEINSFTIAEGTFTASSLITLEISATGADELYIEGDVNGQEKWIPYSTSKTVSLTEGQGNKTVNLKVRDKAENVAGPESRSIMYDPNPPSLFFDIVEGEYTNRRVINLEISAKDADSFRIDGDVEGDRTHKWIARPGSKFTEQVTLVGVDEEKPVTVTVRNDTTGTEVTKGKTIFLDTTPPQNPTLSLSSPVTGSQNYTKNPVNVSIGNLDTDVAAYILNQTYSTRPDGNDSAWGGVPTIPSTFILSGEDGPKTVYLWVKDIAGNINVGVSSATITLDRQVPVNISFWIQEGDYTNSRVIHLNGISATGAGDILIDGNVQDANNVRQWINHTNSQEVTLTSGEGAKTVTIKFRDAAGNETSEIGRAIILDVTPPVIEDIVGARFVKHEEELQEGEETGCHNPTFSWQEAIDNFRVNGYSVNFSTNSADQPGYVIDTSTVSIGRTLTRLHSDGTYYFKVKAIDKAGNLSVGVAIFTYVYKADWVEPAAGIYVENRKERGNEVKGVEESNALPEITFNEGVWGVEDCAEVVAIRTNEGKEINIKIGCNITSDANDVVWTLNPQNVWKSNYTYRIKVKKGIEDKTGNPLMEEKELIFTTMLDYTKRNIVLWESEGNPEDPKTKMILEANALKEDGYVLINLEPLKEAEEARREAIKEADEKVKRGGDRYCYNLRETMKEMRGYTRKGDEMQIEKFLSSVCVELPYEDKNKNGTVDSTEGTPFPVREQTLTIYWLDEEHKLWVKVPGTEVDKNNNVASAKVMGFGIYTLMGGSFFDLSEAYAYPVPYKPNDGLSSTGDKTTGITFTNLSTEAEIKIYTITGELVKKIIHKGGYTEEWYPVENEKGEKVVSGVYIYYIKNEKQHKSGKLVIIR